MRPIAIFQLALIILLLAVTAAAQDDQKADYIYFESDNYICRFQAPEDWKFDLDNARMDNYSAAIIPDTNEYYDAGVIIYLWIFRGENYSYPKFVTTDSSAYIKKNPDIVFKKADSVLTQSKQRVTYYETADPGGKYELTFVGYIPTGKEIIIYEMNITSRLYYSDAHFKFREAMSGFSIEDKGE